MSLLSTWRLAATLALVSVAAAVVGGCQQSAPATQAPAPAINPAAPAPPTASTQPPLPLLFAAADTLTPTMREVLRHHDLSVLRQHPGEDTNLPLDPFEGFFGPEHYHFALVLTRVARDAADPAVYHVAGKARYFPSRSIRPFTGTFTVRQVRPLVYPGFLAAHARSYKRGADSLAGRTYVARARVQLREAASANSGVFEGEALLDFFTMPGQPAACVYVFGHEGPDDQLPTRGGGVLLRGSRRNVSTGQVKPFAVSPYLPAVTPHVLADFLLDERMGNINPKYTHLGWEDYWSNEEWWADSPKPKLSL